MIPDRPSFSFVLTPQTIFRLVLGSTLLIGLIGQVQANPVQEDPGASSARGRLVQDRARPGDDVEFVTLRVQSEQTLSAGDFVRLNRVDAETGDPVTVLERIRLETWQARDRGAVASLRLNREQAGRVAELGRQRRGRWEVTLVEKGAAEPDSRDRGAVGGLQIQPPTQRDDPRRTLRGEPDRGVTGGLQIQPPTQRPGRNEGPMRGQNDDDRSFQGGLTVQPPGVRGRTQPPAREGESDRGLGAGLSVQPPDSGRTDAPPARPERDRGLTGGLGVQPPSSRSERGSTGFSGRDRGLGGGQAVPERRDLRDRDRPGSDPADQALIDDINNLRRRMGGGVVDSLKDLDRDGESTESMFNRALGDMAANQPPRLGDRPPAETRPDGRFRDNRPPSSGQSPPLQRGADRASILRDSARLLDQIANDLEDAGAFSEADETRDLADLLRKKARAGR